MAAHRLLLSSAAPAAGGRRVVLVPGRVHGGCQCLRAELGGSLRLALGVGGVELLGGPAGSGGLLGAALGLPHAGDGVGENRQLGEQREQLRRLGLVDEPGGEQQPGRGPQPLTGG
jgi:hypothetical protein